jgi:hypothetical protein
VWDRSSQTSKSQSEGFPRCVVCSKELAAQRRKDGFKLVP